MVNDSGKVNVTVETASPDETRAIGECLGGCCAGGEIILLYGDLGAGKTCFTQGVAKGLGVAEWVTSPTFTIHGEYVGGRLVLNHLDLYRLEDPCSQEGLGIGDLLGEPNGVAVVEWPEMLADGVEGDRLEVVIADLGEGRRRLDIAAFGDAPARLLNGAMGQ